MSRRASAARLRIGDCVIARSTRHHTSVGGLAAGRRGVVSHTDWVDYDGRRVIEVYLFPHPRYQREGVFDFWEEELTRTKCRSVEARHIYLHKVEGALVRNIQRRYAVVHDGMQERLPTVRKRRRR